MTPTAYQLRLRRALDAIGPALDQDMFDLRLRLVFEIIGQLENAILGSSLPIDVGGNVEPAARKDIEDTAAALLSGTEFAAAIQSWFQLDTMFLRHKVEPFKFEPETYYERVVRAAIDKEPTSGGNPSNVSISVTVNPGATDSEALREAIASAVRTGFMQSMESAAAKNQA